ncbi:MAG: SDR family oxidoreductase [Armatimonadota bacterium]
MARYLVTGGAGFIGSHIVDALVARGDSVVVLDNLSTGKLANLEQSRERIDFVEADLRNPEALSAACRGVDCVFHHAAIASVPRSVEHPIASNEVNASGTLGLLVAARDAGVRRVVYAGSSSAYGDAASMPVTEQTPVAPLSPYAVSKHIGELYCQVFSRLYGLETVVLRYFNVFGPRQDPASEYAAVIPKFITALQRGQSPVIFGDGEQTRDFVYVGNVVEANLLASSGAAAPGRVLNIAGGARTSLNALVAAMQRVTEVSVAPTYAPPRPGDILHSFADISRARELLGYQVTVPLDEGLRLTAEWFRSHS